MLHSEEAGVEIWLEVSVSASLKGRARKWYLVDATKKPHSTHSMLQMMPLPMVEGPQVMIKPHLKESGKKAVMAWQK